MADIRQLLQIAVEDNIAWCSSICSAHGSNEISSFEAWANFDISPPFYPNIITRRMGAQSEVEELAREVRKTNKSTRWGIKDSFGDLTLTDLGFERVLVGRWYGGISSKSPPVDWKTIASPDELRSWEKAWGHRDDAIFPGALLEDHRISFWFRGEPGEIEAGFISFDTGFSLGISNWFSLKNESFARMGVSQAAGSVSQGLPIVCWSTDDLTLGDTGLAELGPLQVWISQ